MKGLVGGFIRQVQFYPTVTIVTVLLSQSRSRKDVRSDSLLDKNDDETPPWTLRRFFETLRKSPGEGCPTALMSLLWFIKEKLSGSSSKRLRCRAGRIDDCPLIVTLHALYLVEHSFLYTAKMNRLGEVVFPVSRAVGEDDDSDDDETKSTSNVTRAPVFRWNDKLLNGANQLECECLLIAIGPVASGFIDSLFGSEERETLCSISCEGNDQPSQTRKQTSESSSIIWRRKGKPLLALCQCREVISNQQSHSWVQQLFSTAKPLTVMILSSHRVGELKTDMDLLSRGDSYPLFSLRSSSLTTRPCCPYLEPPNTVGGLGAEVLTYCEVRRLPGVLYVTFISDREPLALLIASFMPLLSCSILQPYIKDVSQQLAAEQKQLTSFMKDTGSLYT